MNETIITPTKPWKKFWHELWEYKEVLLFLGWRDILVHYRQTVIGILWVVIRPLLTVAIFTIIFSKIARIQTDGVPYALVVFSGMLAWQFFADTMTYGSNSFIANEQLISKIYFPRIMLPASRLLCSFVDFGIAFVCYISIATFYYQIPFSPKILVLPVFILWLAIVTLSLSLFFASLIVRYRDFRHVLPFMIQLGVYCTPVGFSLSMVPRELQFVLALNPLTGVINGFRYALLSEKICYAPLAVSLLMTFVCVFISAGYFKRAEVYFADLI